VLRDALKDLWSYRIPATPPAPGELVPQGPAQRHRAADPLRPPLRPYLPGILAHCRWPLGTNLVEGINNKIKVIKRMAYGFRDDAYFFLKIRAAFPGVGR
jgi:transposase